MSYCLATSRKDVKILHAKNKSKIPKQIETISFSMSIVQGTWDRSSMFSE